MSKKRVTSGTGGPPQDLRDGRTFRVLTSFMKYPANDRQLASMLAGVPWEHDEIEWTRKTAGDLATDLASVSVADLLDRGEIVEANSAADPYGPDFVDTSPPIELILPEPRAYGRHERVSQDAEPGEQAPRVWSPEEQAQLEALQEEELSRLEAEIEAESAPLPAPDPAPVLSDGVEGGTGEPDAVNGAESPTIDEEAL